MSRMSNLRLLVGLLGAALAFSACAQANPSPSKAAISASPTASPSAVTSLNSSASPSADQFSIWNATLAGWRDGRAVVVLATWSALNGNPGPTSIWEYDPITGAWSTTPAPIGVLSGVFTASAQGSNLVLIGQTDPPLTTINLADSNWLLASAPAGDALSNQLAPLSDGRLMAIGDSNLTILDLSSGTWTSLALPEGYVLLGATSLAGRYLLAPLDDISREGGLGFDFHIVVWNQGADTTAGPLPTVVPLADHALAVDQLGNGQTVIRLVDGWYRLDSNNKLSKLASFKSASPFVYLSDDTKTMAVLDCNSSAVPGPSSDDCALAFGPAVAPVAQAAFGRHDVFGLSFAPDGTAAILTGSRAGLPSGLQLFLAAPGQALHAVAVSPTAAWTAGN